ncbi:MAG: trimeric autotransporter adhesin [Patescibacteria group bacterium]|nr:trimeric autotransporter adhesin [Patescibacteria group bacterium]
MTDFNLQKTKSNLAWVSVLVVFFGAVIYVPMVQLSEKREEVVYYRVPVIVPVVTSVEGKPTDTDNEVKIDKPKLLLTKDLKMGDVDPEVKILQEYLNSNGFTVALSGPGSPGKETELFGRDTKEALIKFQEANSEILLKPFGLSQGTGFLGELTRKLINS